MQPQISIPSQQINDFCRVNHIRRLSLFGSVLREDFRPDSDIDVLVEFAPEHSTGFLHFMEMQETLSSIFGGRRVDLVTPKSLNHRIRSRILAEAEVQYER